MPEAGHACWGKWQSSTFILGWTSASVSSSSIWSKKGVPKGFADCTQHHQVFKSGEALMHLRYAKLINTGVLSSTLLHF